jgi:hypothetical protein
MRAVGLWLVKCRLSASAPVTPGVSSISSSRCFFYAESKSVGIRTTLRPGVPASIQRAAAFRDEHVEREAKLEGSRLARPRR